MKLKNKILVFVIATMTVTELTYNNSKINKLLLDNIEALTDSYEEKIDANGNTLKVNYTSTELKPEQKKELKSEAYYVYHGLPNPYHWMHVTTEPALKESFYNETQKRWDEINRCNGGKELCTGTITGVCWSVKYSLYGS